MQDDKPPTQTTSWDDFFEIIETAEMALKIARRLGKPHGAFAAFAVSWVQAMSALEQELRERTLDLDQDKGCTMTDLMREIQQDKRAFVLLTARLLSSEPPLTFGKLLERDGDPRLWPEYANAT